MSFQSQVNAQPAPAVAGDFASANPRATVLAGPGGLVAGASGVTVGRFAWLETLGNIVRNYGTAPHAPTGFVHREQQALITQFLAATSNLVPEGLPVTLHNQGDFWAVNDGAQTSAIGDAIYATYANGKVTTGAAATGASATGSMGSTNTASLGATFTATGTGTSFVVTGVTGLISIGDEIAGTGVTAGTTIDAQVSGTPGGAGTYTTSAATTSAADTITSFGDVVKVTVTTGLISVGDTVAGGAGFPVGATVTAILTGTGGAGTYRLSDAGSAYTASATGVTTYGDTVNVTAVASGTLEVGDPITGTGVPANSVIASQVTGTAGGIGVYTISNRASAYAASTTLTAVAGVITSWKAASIAAPGELVKITTWG